MNVKTLFKTDRECKVKSPWLIEQISNGLKARNVKVIGGVVVKTNKAIPIKYFMYDRIFGTGSYDTVLKVMEMFDELQDVTPRSIGYIFQNSIYLNYDRGILKRNNKTGVEDFFSEQSLRNKALADYLKLDDCQQDSTYEEEDTDRADVHNTCTELERSKD